MKQLSFLFVALAILGTVPATAQGGPIWIPTWQTFPFWEHVCQSEYWDEQSLWQIHDCDVFNAISRPCVYFFENAALCPDGSTNPEDCYKSWGVRSCSLPEKVACGIDMGLPGPCDSHLSLESEVAA